jgi:hypothetical protein
MIGLEATVALLFVVGLVGLRARSLGKTNGALEAKVIELRRLLKGVRGELKAARTDAATQSQQPAPDYGDLIDAQISATRNHHLELNPDRDIVLDMATDASLERRAVSLRHAFLIAEKEAWLASESGREVDWSVLQAKLGQVIQFYEQPVPAAPVEDVFPDTDGLEALDLDTDIAPPDTLPDTGEITALQEIIENQKRHIENLERFKKLFFEADDKWHRASRQAEQYRQEILAQSRGFNASDEFNALLEKYNQVYVEFGGALSVDGESPRNESAPVIAIDANQPSVGRMVIANQEELQRLRNMAVDQHKMILRLRQELEGAHSLEEKDRVISELSKQLERHERFLKESDLCTKQLENELERVLDENHTLKMKMLELKQQAAETTSESDVEQMSNIIEDFTRQSSEMLNALEMLEAECGELRQQLQDAQADPAQVGQLKQQLAAAQQELLNLQAQHIELEERYLELKSASI